ncbi:cyclin-O-like, partial [Indicator indicator]|uniref:cyclin-O-like n=1 Tax=Indicator indicator TaxID=1002788 RepID=UPI0023DF58E0
SKGAVLGAVLGAAAVSRRGKRRRTIRGCANSVPFDPAMDFVFERQLPTSSAQPGSPQMVSGGSEHQCRADCLWRPRAAAPVLAASREQLQAFREYGESWYLSVKELESRFPPREPLAQQPQVTAKRRCKLVGWLRLLNEYLSLSFETFCQAINILDRFLVTTPVATDCFQLLGLTALFIASKQVEVQPPTMEELLAHCSGAFSRQQLRNLECIVLRRLNFDLAAPTLSFFLEYFNLVRLEAPRADAREAADARSLAVGIAGLSLADYAFIDYAPSLLAAGSLGLADRLLQHRRPANLEVSGYPEELLQDCMAQLHLLVSLNEDSLSALLPWEVARKCSWRHGSR